VSQTSVKNNMCVLTGYVDRVLQNGALKWKKKRTGVRSRAASCLRYSIGKFGAVSEIWKMYGWQVLPHPPYSPDMSPPDYFFPKLKKSLCGKRFRNFEGVFNEATPSNQTHQRRRRPDRNTRLSQTLDGCDKAQWRLH
jgi:transposase